MPANLRPLTTD